MHLSNEKYPIDIIIIILCTLVLIPIILFQLNETIRIILGLPFILFFPGYCLIFTLFPEKKSTTGIDVLERIALSFGMSIAIVPLIGLALNYTVWGIRLQPILFSLVLFILCISVIGIFRWYHIQSNRRFHVDITLSFPKGETRLDRILTIILCCSMILAVSTLVYVIASPKEGEHFTEFYLLGSEGIADNYPKNITTTEPVNLVIGVVNHEYRTIDYTLEIWLINQSTIKDTQTNETSSTYHHMWFVENITIQLPHIPIDIEGSWEPQWEYNWTTTFNRTGSYKLAFFLFTSPQETYSTTNDYHLIAQEKIDTAYRSVHLWVTIN